ncbi:hypothetical protein TNCV_249761 [Trichonephila clavipes]|nr:hypothetical protein TNCV_249761 [Trichonephila clavipes]
MDLHYWDVVDSDFIFMDNNALPHRVCQANEFNESEDKIRDGQARSPELNSIYHIISDVLGSTISTHLHSP